MVQRSSRQLILFIFILYTIHLCHSYPQWGYPTKTRIIISNGPPITQFKGTSYKIVPSSTRFNGRRHVHGPGRRYNGFKPSLADCKNQGEWKPIIGHGKSNFAADIKNFQKVHPEEHHESPQHNIEHHEQPPPNFDSFESTQHREPSNPGREVKPTSWAVSTSNIDFGGSSDFSGNNNNDYGNINNNNNNNDYGNNNNNDYGNNNNNDYGSVSNPGTNSVSFGTDPWWQSNEDGFKSSGPAGEIQSSQDITDDNSFLSHSSKDYAVHEKVEGDIPPPKMRPNGGRQLLPSIVPTSTPKPFRPPPPPPPPPSPPTSHSDFRPNFFRKRRQKPGSTLQIIKH